MFLQQYVNNHHSVVWQGYNVNNQLEYETFMKNNVRNRLNDTSGQASVQGYLKTLASNGFEIDNLNDLFNSVAQEQRDWAVGESFSEAVLEDLHGAVFPWNNARDLRNENGSLPGADIVGLINDAGQYKILLGEVKTSIETNYPPNVLYGRSGMTYQLETIGTNLTRLMTLITWLVHRCKGTSHEDNFSQAFKYLIQNTNKGMFLVGILVRPNILANENDFKSRGTELGNMFNGTALRISLQAYYLPHSLCDFANLAIEGNP